MLEIGDGEWTSREGAHKTESIGSVPRKGGPPRRYPGLWFGFSSSVLTHMYSEHITF